MLQIDEQGRVTGSPRDLLDLLEALARTALQMSPEQRAQVRADWNAKDLLAMPVGTMIQCDGLAGPGYWPSNTD
jgi:hypothetical protein